MKFSDGLLKRIGDDALAMITEQIGSGVDYEGGSYAYSTKPFWRPWAPDVVRKLGGKAGEGTFYHTFFSHNTGAAGLLILGGYKAYKEKMNPTAASKYLTWSGKMLRNMKPFAPADDSITIGWTDPVIAQRAFWLNVSGAGRSRKLWKFLGLSAKHQEDLVNKYGPEVTKEIARDMAETLIKGMKS
jgi:hypothetical protein